MGGGGERELIFLLLLNHYLNITEVPEGHNDSNGRSQEPGGRGCPRCTVLKPQRCRDLAELSTCAPTTALVVCRTPRGKGRLPSDLGEETTQSALPCRDRCGGAFRGRSAVWGLEIPS